MFRFLTVMIRATEHPNRDRKGAFAPTLQLKTGNLSEANLILVQITKQWMTPSLE